MEQGFGRLFVAACPLFRRHLQTWHLPAPQKALAQAFQDLNGRSCSPERLAFPGVPKAAAGLHRSGLAGSWR